MYTIQPKGVRHQVTCVPLGLKRRDRLDDFICGHNGAGIVRNIDVESGVHLLIRVICRRVFYHRDLVAKLNGITNSCLDTGMGYQSHDDELIDSVSSELRIQIRVSETTRTPVLQGHHIAGLRLEFESDLAAPRAVFEGLVRPRCLLNRRDVLPALVVA